MPVRRHPVFTDNDSPAGHQVQVPHYYCFAGLYSTVLNLTNFWENLALVSVLDRKSHSQQSFSNSIARDACRTLSTFSTDQEIRDLELGAMKVERFNVQHCDGLIDHSAPSRMVTLIGIASS